ncbi:MAG: phosphoesterase, partial [Alicyclobacillaceae bacterium]|nr:phosphoesterase [Alicyclobacillaceae bacterium]
LYLGLHWPADVLAGWALGLVFAVGGWWVGRWWTYRVLGFRWRLGFAVGVPVILCALHPQQPAAEYAAMLLGLGVGALAEERWLALDIDPAWWKRACAAVIGIAGMIALQWVVKWPQDVWAWPMLRGAALGLWASLGAPFLFALCGLYRRAEANA